MIKILNGSDKLINVELVNILKDEIIFGKNSNNANNLIFYGFLLFFSTLIYNNMFFGFNYLIDVGFNSIFVFLLIKLVNLKPLKDPRLIYKAKDIEAFQIDYNNGNSFLDKNMAKSLTGAAVGGALFGGFGAVVGSNASGNKIKKIDCAKIAIRFNDDQWVVMMIEEDEIIKKILQFAGKKNICPI